MDDDRQARGQTLTPATELALAHVWAEALEDREAKRAGLPVEEVRATVARKTGVPTGKLYSLRRGRLKEIPGRYLKALGDALIGELQRELARVEHDLGVCTQIGVPADSGEVISLRTSRQKIREALGLEPPVTSQGGGDV